MIDAVKLQVVMQLGRQAFRALDRSRSLARRLVALAMLAPLALLACAKSDAIEASSAGGLGGFNGRGGSSGNEAGPEGVGGFGGDSSGNVSPDASGSGGFDGDEQSSAATGIPEECGDGLCDTPVESCETCVADCGACEEEPCGDGTCDGTQGETCDICAADCGSCPECGDGICEEPVEDCELCAEDCGVCPCESDALEPNGGSGSGSPLTLGVVVDELSICGNDIDWFRFTKSGTTSVTISFVDAEGDLDLEIYNPNYVAGSYGGGNSETVVLSAQPNGTYYARVYGAPKGSGTESRSYSILVD